MTVVKTKKQKAPKSVSQKRELKFGNYKNCLELNLVINVLSRKK